MRRSYALATTGLVLCLVLAGCQQIFTTSLGEPLKRSKLPVPSSLSAQEAAQQVATLDGDVDRAQALMPALADLVVDNPGDTDVLSDAVAAASIATGVENAFFQALDVISIDDLTSGADLTSAQIADLSGLLGSISVSGDTTSIFEELAAAPVEEMKASGANASQYVVASIALVVADAESQGLDIATLMNEATPFTSYTPSTANGTDALLQSLMNAATAGWPEDTFLSGMQDIFGNALPPATP